MARPKPVKPPVTNRTVAFAYRFDHEQAKYEMFIPCAVCGEQIKKPHEATVFFTQDSAKHGKSWCVHNSCVESFEASIGASRPELYEDTVANWLFGLLQSVKRVNRITHVNTRGERKAKVSIMIPDPV